jgi:hypothetical protein
MPMPRGKRAESKTPTVDYAANEQALAYISVEHTVNCTD